MNVSCEPKRRRAAMVGHRHVAVVVLSFSALVGAAHGQERALKTGDVITETTSITPGGYRIPDPADKGAVQIVGNGIVVDFRGAELIGAAEGTTPDGYTGRGIVVRGRDVTIKNAKVRGFKVGIFAEDSPGLTLEGCDVSGNYRQRLKSTKEREHLDDWIYGHENDANEWLRYGAGIYLVACPRATVKDCRARDGQNGLCLVRCDESTIIDNDMAFLSGWGLAMWRTSRCQVWHNKFDWCMRGYSHGVYSRGQDSAGILVYEQCHENVFAYNSATHSGDGFFLYAGNETLKETGQGGCNRNLVYRNDFSHAAANGIEATFSDGNVFIQNVMDECEHGVWAGYSYNTVIAENLIARCKNGISIEHGSKNGIAGNVLRENKTGIHLWWDDDKDLLESVFCKSHDGCPSQRNGVIRNTIVGSEIAVRLNGDRGSGIEENRVSESRTSLHLAGNMDGLHATLAKGDEERIVKQEVGGKVELDFEGFEAPEPLPTWESRYPSLAQRAGSRKVFLKFPDAKVAPWLDELSPWVDGESRVRRGRRFIVIDEWGPVVPKPED